VNRTKYCVDESTVVFTAYNNQPSIIGTLLNCLLEIQDAMVSPVYSLGETLNISTTVVLNNLVSISEMTNEAVFDLVLLLRWQDYRLDMPALWAACDPWVYEFGVELSQAAEVFNIQGTQAAIWLPDIIFPDATNDDIVTNSFKIYPEGEVRYQAHIRVTLAQPNFQYDDYPCDSQTIMLRFKSFNLDSTQVSFKPFMENSFHTFLATPKGGSAFSQNPIWTLVDSSSDSVSDESIVLVSIKLSRKSLGVLKRLGIPILLLVILSGITFWADPSDRVSTTVDLLLALTTLYLVIFANIPMVGTFSLFDLYVIMMFILLFMSTALHQLVCTLRSKEKLEKWPLRQLYIRLLEFIGRTFVIPFAVITYAAIFHKAVGDYGLGIAISLCAVFVSALAFRDIFGLLKLIPSAMKEVGNKSHSSNMSLLETVVFNWYMYHVWSTKLYCSDNTEIEKSAGVRFESEGLEMNPVFSSSS
jgi:hypothetical protein